MEDFKRVEEECNKIGLTVNSSKCEIFNCQTTHNDFKHIDSCSFELLGAPMLDESTDIALNGRLAKFKAIAEKLQTIPHHHAFTVLKSSLGVCRLISTLRSSPCDKSPIAAEFDNAIHSTLESVLNLRLSSDTFSQAALPIKMGGFGISSLKNISVSSYLAFFYRFKKCMTQVFAAKF